MLKKDKQISQAFVYNIGLAILKLENSNKKEDWIGNLKPAMDNFVFYQIAYLFLQNRLSPHTLSQLMRCEVISGNSAMRELVGLNPINDDDEFDIIEETWTPKPPANPNARLSNLNKRASLKPNLIPGDDDSSPAAKLPALEKAHVKTPPKATQNEEPSTSKAHVPQKRDHPSTWLGDYQKAKPTANASAEVSTVENGTTPIHPKLIFPANFNAKPTFEDLVHCFTRYFRKKNARKSKELEMNKATLTYGTHASIDIVKFVVEKALPDKVLSDKTVEMCFKKGALHETVYFAKLFKLKKNTQEKRVQEIWDAPMQFRKVDISKFHKLNTEEVNVIFVDSNEKAYKMMKVLVKKAVIAFDVEGIPFSNGVMALLQIACNESVYLVDTITSQIGNDCWSQLAALVFNNNDIIKIGENLNFVLRISKHTQQNCI